MQALTQYQERAHKNCYEQFSIGKKMLFVNVFLY